MAGRGADGGAGTAAGAAAGVPDGRAVWAAGPGSCARAAGCMCAFVGLHAGLTRLPGAEARVVTQNDLECPITGDLFENPVIAADGHTYSRSGIERWFREGKTTSPLTNKPLDNLELLQVTLTDP